MLRKLLVLSAAACCANFAHAFTPGGAVMPLKTPSLRIAAASPRRPRNGVCKANMLVVNDKLGAQFKELFDLADADNSGYIDPKEFDTMVKCMGGLDNVSGFEKLPKYSDLDTNKVQADKSALSPG
jgi:hypothetical protein